MPKSAPSEVGLRLVAVGAKEGADDDVFCVHSQPGIDTSHPTIQLSMCCRVYARHMPYRLKPAHSRLLPQNTNDTVVW